ncbi:MAG: electron transfer flavoprotein subunit beta/FixA family protein [Candidatus Caldarchaeum sp.]|nr:electron transfer flavoprotein subunit beta/FixA family protein [Candidatus Caldarchaeum sp.]
MPDVVVCVKQTVDVYQLKPHPETLAPQIGQAQWKNSDFDLNALEEALRIREKHGGKVYVVSAGHDVKPLLVRECLAMGADEAFVLSDPSLEKADGSATVKVLSSIIKAKIPRWDLILCGEASLDQNSYQTGPRLAEIFNVPHVSYVTKLEVGGGGIKAWRAVEDGVEVVSCNLPAVVTVGLEINTPRLPSLLMIRAAQRKPLNELKLSDVGLTSNDVMPKAETVEIKALKTERKKQKFEGKPEELAERLAELIISNVGGRR